MAATRKDLSTDAMLALREQGKSNAEIAYLFGVSAITVRKRIGTQPKDLTQQAKQKGAAEARAKKAAKKVTEKPVAKTPSEPQNAPSEPEKVEEVQEVKEAPATPQKRKNIEQTRLFEFAFCKDWLSMLHTLSKEVAPEPWAFKKRMENRKNNDLYILEQYILQTFSFRVSEYNSSTDDLDKVIHMRGKFCCLHTGLYDRQMQGIYMYFEKTLNPGVTKPWIFVGFKHASSPVLSRVHPLPEHRTLKYELAKPFDPRKTLRANTSHITGRADRLERLPEAIRGYWNLPLLLETSVEYARRKAAIVPGSVVTTRRFDTQTWLLPLYITNPDTPDTVAMIEDMGDFYHLRTCITPEMAYLYARNNGRPTADWLVALLDTDNGGGVNRKE